MLARGGDGQRPARFVLLALLACAQVSSMLRQLCGYAEGQLALEGTRRLGGELVVGHEGRGWKSSEQRQSREEGRPAKNTDGSP